MIRVWLIQMPHQPDTVPKEGNSPEDIARLLVHPFAFGRIVHIELTGEHSHLDPQEVLQEIRRNLPDDVKPFYEED